jgi:hypothetical protein
MATVAGAADWRVTQMSGQVYVQQGPVRLASLSAGLVLKNGAVVVTRKNGRVLLVRGEQTMIVSPNSTVALPAESGRFTRILERSGQVEYDVDRREAPHFTVETPYLAAVVKGTRFKVSVYNGGASVRVLRGRVEVTDLKTGQRADVLPGQKAVVSSRGGLAIEGTGKIQPIRQGQPVDRSQAGKQGETREADARPSPSQRADNGSVSSSIGRDRSAAAGGKSVSVGGRSVGAGGVDATVSAGAGNGNGVSVSVGAGKGTVSAQAGGDGVGIGVGIGHANVSARAGGNGFSASVGGLSVGIR